MANSEIPRFIELRGCINCEASKRLKEKTGHPYGFHHEILLHCLRCSDHDLTRPFYDPAEVARLALEMNEPEARQRAIDWCLAIKKYYGHFYEQLGISLDEIIGELEGNK